MTLTAQETALLERFRALPDDDSRERMLQLSRALGFYIQNHRCLGMGAEGFPCGEPPATCDECHRTWDLLDQLGAKNA